MSKKYTKNLTEGNVFKQLVTFALPFLLSNFLQAMYSVCDLFIVGKVVGTDGITAVSISGQVMMMISALIIGFSVGGNVIVAQYVGARDHNSAAKAVGTLFTLFLILALVMSVLGFVFCVPILKLVNTPPEALDMAASYLRICCAGNISIFGYNAVSSVLRALGDSKRPLYFVIVSTVLNIVLDYIFVAVFSWDAAGAALATVIAQTVSFVLVVYTLRKSEFIFDFKLKSFGIRKDMLKRIIKVGLPSSAQMALMSMSFLFLSALVNKHGSSASAAFGIGGKIDNFAVMPALAISAAVSSMIGQNVGAKEYERVKKTLFSAFALSFVISLTVFLLVQAFSADTIKLFMDASMEADVEETIRVGVSYLSIVSYAYLIFAFMFQLNGLANGSGYTIFTLVNVISSVIVARVPLAYLLSEVLDYGINGVFIAMAAAPLAGTASGLIFFFSGKWKKSRLIDRVIVE